jgi:hypothetical protein
LLTFLVCIRSGDGAATHFKKLNANLLCLLYGGKMGQLKLMRKHLKEKIIEGIETLGPKIMDNFEMMKIKRKDTENEEEDESKMIISYHDALELNEAFESLKELGI